MLTVHYSSYQNGLPLSVSRHQYNAARPQHDMALPYGGRLCLKLFDSDTMVKPFGLQEDIVVCSDKTTHEGIVFFYKGWEECHVTLVAQDTMVFVAFSKKALQLEDLVADYATDTHALAEYLPICYTALAA